LGYADKSYCLCFAIGCRFAGANGAGFPLCKKLSAFAVFGKGKNSFWFFYRRKHQPLSF
jgi:hypothetical protein